jgi:hypothetical protein
MGLSAYLSRVHQSSVAQAEVALDSHVTGVLRMYKTGILLGKDRRGAKTLDEVARYSAGEGEER